MNQTKLKILIPLSVFLLVLMSSWKNGEVDYVILTGGIGVTILLYFILAELTKGFRDSQTRLEEHSQQLQHQLNEWKRSNDLQLGRVGELIEKSVTEQDEISRKHQEKLMENLENQLQRKVEVMRDLHMSVIEGFKQLDKSASSQEEQVKAIVMKIEQQEKATSSYREKSQNKLDAVLQLLKRQDESYQGHLTKQQGLYEKLMKEVKEIEVTTQKTMMEQSTQQLLKTEALVERIEAYSKEQLTNFHTKVSYLVEQLWAQSSEQVLSMNDLAHRINENGENLHGLMDQSLSSYKDGLQAVLESMKDSTVHIQKEIVQQSHAQMGRVEEVIGTLNQNSVQFHEKMEGFVESTHASTISAQEVITSSAVAQLQQVEQQAGGMKERFEDMQSKVVERMQDQYNGISSIIAKLGETVEGSQTILEGYTTQQINRISDVVGIMKSETAKSLEELKVQGIGQLNKMQEFLERSKLEADDTRSSMNLHHQDLLKELEHSLEKIVHNQTEENKIIVQKTAEFITQFTMFHKELIGENHKQLELTEQQQKEFMQQVEAYRELLIPLTDIHHNLQEMSKEEYQKLYETMGLLSASLVETIESKNSLRTHIVRIQEDMLQKLR
jgi:hypothetical protein